MRSPFEIFRKHQKMLTVVLTGLAMFAFVILGAVPDPSAMPPALGAIVMGGVVGGLAWLAGIRRKKSNEWGAVGFIAGLGLGLAAMMAVGPGDVVRADTGNINQDQLRLLSYQRSLANQFLGRGYQIAQENGYQARGRQFQFGFGHPDDTRDIVLGELLRREADKLGMQVTDHAVNEFIRGRFEGKLGAPDVREIRNSLRVSESELYDALAAELTAFEAYRFFYDGITVPGRNPLPPVEYWDFYRKMHIENSAGIVALPVDAFLDSSAEPTEAELLELFDKHKANLPNTTTDGRLEEGLIGFLQPRRVALEYIEIPYESVEATIPEITDEEIEQFYEENYASASDLEMPAGEGTATPDGPVLPDLTPEEPPADEKPSGENADDEPSTDAKETDEKPADPQEPAETPQPQPESEPESETPESADEKAPAPSDDAATETDEANQSSEESDGPAEETDQPADQGGASLNHRPALQTVALFDDEQPTQADDGQETEDSEPADQPSPPVSEEAPADDTPPDDTSADDDTPADEEPAGESEPSDAETSPDEATTPPETDTPPPPPAPPAPRELDDDLRSEIRDQLLRQRTSDRQEKLMREAFELMGLKLSSGMMALEDDPSEITPEQATEKLKQHAEKAGLVYRRTPLLSYRELQQSEEHPLGRASSATNVQSAETVADMAFGAAPTSLHHARQAVDIGGSRFVFWKVEDVESYEPQSLDDPGIREQVVRAWRELKAREKAQARAEQLARLADGADKPLSEVFAEQTIADQEDSPAITVLHPPRFTWLSAADPRQSPNPWNLPAPMLTELRTIPGDVGEEFMQVVFNQLQPTEAGVAHSIDKDYYYVVRIEDRTFGNSPDLQAFRERFASEQVFDQFGFTPYFKLAARELAGYQTNWADELFERHNVTIAESEPSDEAL